MYDKLHGLVKKLDALLDDPQPGLSSWHDAVDDLAGRIASDYEFGTFWEIRMKERWGELKKEKEK